MGALDEFSFAVRTFLRAYPWRTIDPVPWTTLTRPLSACRLALVSTAGFVVRGMAPLDDSIRGGDCSFRAIPGDVDVGALVENHRSDSFDHTAMRRDPNLAFPVDRVRELVAQGVIGSVAPRHLSFMGSITAPGRLVKETAPEAARLLVADAVDVALLVPV